MKRKYIAALAATLAVSLLVPLAASAASTESEQKPLVHQIDQGSVILRETWNGGDFIAEADGCPGHEITGTSSNTILVKSGHHKITLNSVKIDASGTALPGGCAFKIEPGASADLTLIGDNSFKSANYPGMWVPDGAKLTIAQGTNAATGSIEAIAGSGAGIGGYGFNGTAGEITINSGTVTATGSGRGAGIGGNQDGGAGIITINGGTVIATGGANKLDKGNSPGIGCGSSGTGGGQVIINKGAVTATGGTNNQNAPGYGINCGSLSSEPGSMVIITSNIANNVSLTQFNGMVKSGANYSVYGQTKIPDGFKLDNGTLNLKKDSFLSIPDHWKCEGDITGVGGNIVNADKLGEIQGSIADGVGQWAVLADSDITASSPLEYNGENLTDTAISVASRRTIGVKEYKVYDKDWIREINGSTTEQIKDVGKYTVTYTYVYDKNRKYIREVEVTPKSLTEIKGADIKIEDQTYDGEAKEPELEIAFTNKNQTRVPLVAGEDYTAVYSDNTSAGDAKVAITSVPGGNYCDNTEATFKIAQASIKDAEVTIDSDTYEYDRQVKSPTVAVKLGDETLALGTDYTLAYSDEEGTEVSELIDAGKYTLTITGTGNYADVVTREITIKKRKLTLGTVTAGDKKYDGEPTVPITEITWDPDDKGEVITGDHIDVNYDGLVGEVKSADVKGSPYTEVKLPKELPLTGEDAGNYYIDVPEGWKKLTSEVKIMQGDSPVAPKIRGTYAVSKTDDQKFIYTITLDEMAEGKEKKDYECRMADAEGDGENSGEWKDWFDKKGKESNTFDLITPEPAEPHRFYVRTKETENEKAGEEAVLTEAFLKLDNVTIPEEEVTLTFEKDKDGFTFVGTISPVKAEGFGQALYWFGDEEPKADGNKKTGCLPGQTYTGNVKFAGDATHKESPVTSVTEKTEKLPAKKPTISPNGGAFIGQQQVEITAEVEGVSIYYTTDGTEPAPDNGTKYEGPFLVGADVPEVTVKAIAVAEGMDNSEVAEAVFKKAAGSELETRLVHKNEDGEFVEGIGELTEVPEDVKDKYEDITKLKAALTEPIAEKLGKGYAPKDVEYSDITLQMRVKGGKWVPATLENFPEDGLKVTMPYPEGTSKEKNEFAASHMFAATSDRLGIEAGNIEAPEVTETEDGIVFTVKSTSPVAVGWKKASQDDNNNNGGDDNNDNNNDDNKDDVNGGDNNTNQPGDNNGADGTNGDGQTPGAGDDQNGTDGTDGTTDGTDGADKSGKDGGALSSILPKTGDTSSILLWGVLGVICIAVIVVIVRKKRR